MITNFQEISKAETARLAIRKFQIIAESLFLKGSYRLGSKDGGALEKALRELSPEIYGSMNDPQSIELKGLEYVLDRLPKGIEECRRLVLTAHEDFNDTSFEKIRPLKRRRTSFRVSDHEMSFIITRGSSEVYDILTHITFLYNEAKKIYAKMKNDEGRITSEYKTLEDNFKEEKIPSGKSLDQAIWNLSLYLGRTFKETMETYDHFEKVKTENNASNGLFHIIYHLGRVLDKEKTESKALTITFSPSLARMILHQIHGKKWAAAIHAKLSELNLVHRPLHIISANLHSIVNLLYGFAAVNNKTSSSDLYSFIEQIRDKGNHINDFASKNGVYAIADQSGAQINCQLVDTATTTSMNIHPGLKISKDWIDKQKPVILVMDYAFGTQAFELMDELLKPQVVGGLEQKLNVRSISVMGKAGILSGEKGDIMLASSHVLEGTPHNYTIDSDLSIEDFDEDTKVHVGPIITVLGTSLQNKYLLEKFKTTSWRAVGLEMEGGHYQRAINAAIIRRHLEKDIDVRYAYYASDNPLQTGQTLASGSLGREGIRPTYMITKVILEKILNEKSVDIKRTKAPL